MTEDAPNTDLPTTDDSVAVADTPITLGSELPSESVTPEAEATTSYTPSAGGWFWGTGRRKASVARVRIRPGKGEFEVNGKDLKVYLTEERDHKDIQHVLDVAGTGDSLEVKVNAHGGGYTGQAGAIVLGLARALMRFDGSLEQTLRDSGLLSRDPRRVERKKPGQPGARKSFQFSKR
jgi:small subunit ribosomal protein S9